MEQELIKKTKAFVKQELQHAEGGHDWFHIERVYKNSLLIAKTENVNHLIVALSALLHDIADSKFHDGDESIGPEKAENFLRTLHLDQTYIDHIVQIIKNISFKGGNFKPDFHSAELEVVQDADRLDAIGAIGIARTFNYGGFKNRKIYDPEVKPQLNMTKEAYKKSEAPTINHFYEKLLLLKDRMNTETGKKLAQKRHDFMVDYLNQFYSEWNGTV
ncbi:HD domain-containing protein [Mangrovimonas sp. AS39]|uniref:HD domain-containing protein n=1 Tax=Mangrovimonas futianensis TaxID=2895523 RepID=UPI001E536897|nr:HD domain-containing protein [Mangrovimonas futianensis]MCF1190233.1 HD domain-containing protein [Mangrovimonas futianensis]MCF1194014.1 HD domain-containing protein [Mangrovimonas futianensis]